jgi:ATP-dependent DNA helicase RecG
MDSKVELYKAGSKVGSKVGGKLTENQQKILDLMTGNPHITKEEIVNNLDIGKTTVDNNISKLKKLGLLKRVGSDKAGHFGSFERMK